ncbi:MAG: hypothetical protein Q9167_002357 [Letrouitia subvulpina]
MPQFNKRLPLIAQIPDGENTAVTLVNDQAMNISCDACFNLFNWHRNNEGGLWLADVCDENDEENSTIRRKQSHPWIKADLDAESCSDGEDERDEFRIERNGIETWREKVLDIKESHSQAI